MAYSLSKVSVFMLTFTESDKGKPTADVLAIGNHAVNKLASIQGQEFAADWKIPGNKMAEKIHHDNLNE